MNDLINSDASFAEKLSVEVLKARRQCMENFRGLDEIVMIISYSCLRQIMTSIDVHRFMDTQAYYLHSCQVFCGQRFAVDLMQEADYIFHIPQKLNGREYVGRRNKIVDVVSVSIVPE